MHFFFTAKLFLHDELLSFEFTTCIQNYIHIYIIYICTSSSQQNYLFLHDELLSFELTTCIQTYIHI